MDENGNLLARRLDSNISFGDVASSQDSQIILRIAPVDHYGSVIKTDSSSTGEIEPNNTDSTTLSGVTQEIAYNGVYVFDSF